jgi:hypothetical protein
MDIQIEKKEKKGHEHKHGHSHENGSHDHGDKEKGSVKKDKKGHEHKHGHEKVFIIEFSNGSKTNFSRKKRREILTFMQFFSTTWVRFFV